MVQSKKVIFTFYLLALLPFFFMGFVIHGKKVHYRELSEEIARLPLRIEHTLEKQRDQTAFYKKYGGADRYYIDHVLEVATFLKPEVEALELVNSHPAFESCENVKKRLDFLSKGGNRLIFSEGSRHVKNSIEELELTQKGPVEINTQDLQNLLSLVEGVTVGEYHPPTMSPQLIITRMQLQKKKLAERETFLLEMHLIKKEVLR